MHPRSIVYSSQIGVVELAAYGTTGQGRMRRGATKQGQRGATALSNALKAEKNKYDSDEIQKFFAMRTEDQDSAERQKFPRSLSNGTFFTPHLARRQTTSASKDIFDEYAAILNLNGKWIVTTPTFNPVASQSGPAKPIDTVKLPQKIRDKVNGLEKRGFHYLGKNGDMLVYRRVFNRKQRDRFWASQSALTLFGSVMLLTGSLFAIEHLF